MPLEPFPSGWSTALVLVAHPDDPEYGMAAAVDRWTSEGKRVVYALASSGERGIEGMSPEQCGPLREEEQRTSARVVGVDEVEFWGFPDSSIRNTAELRATIAETIGRVAPQVILSLYGGPEWAPGAPNQRDHMEFSAAVLDAYDAIDGDRPRWLFENGPHPTHAVDVADHIDAAVASLASHEQYLRVLDPDTPVLDQARAQVDSTTGPRDDFGGRRASCFELKRETVPPPRWITDTKPGHSQWYIERFRDMAAQGNDLAGEARLIDAMVPRAARILDAGCGPGRLGGYLHTVGHQVVGVDVDPELIAAAQADHPGPHWLVADLSTLDLAAHGEGEPFDAIVCAGNVMVFLAPDTETLVLRRLSAHLKDDGVLVTGFHTDRELTVEHFDTAVAAAGLRLEHRFATWDLRTWHPDADFAVSVLRK